MVVDRVVQIGVPHSAAVFATGLPAELAVPAAIGDTTEFFDVHVHQIARLWVLVAVGLGAAYR